MTKQQQLIRGAIVLFGVLLIAAGASIYYFSTKGGKETGGRPLVPTAPPSTAAPLIPTAPTKCKYVKAWEKTPAGFACGGTQNKKCEVLCCPI